MEYKNNDRTIFRKGSGGTKLIKKEIRKPKNPLVTCSTAPIILLVAALIAILVYMIQNNLFKILF